MQNTDRGVARPAGNGARTGAVPYAVLARLVRVKRGNASLQQIAEQIQVSPPTLSRIENEQRDNVTTSVLLRICDWLEISLADLMCEDRLVAWAHTHLDAPAYVDVMLRNDPNIAPQYARIIVAAVSAAYYAAKEQEQAE